jgi:hypothetical protein
MATEDGPKKRGLDVLSPTQQFIFLACGVFVFFGTHNVLQEAIMKIPGFEFGVMLGYLEVARYVHKRRMVTQDTVTHSLTHSLSFHKVSVCVPSWREPSLPRKRHASLLSRPIRS